MKRYIYIETYIHTYMLKRYLLSTAASFSQYYILYNLFFRGSPNVVFNCFIVQTFTRSWNLIMQEILMLLAKKEKRELKSHVTVGMILSSNNEFGEVKHVQHWIILKHLNSLLSVRSPFRSSRCRSTNWRKQLKLFLSNNNLTKKWK